MERSASGSLYELQSAVSVLRNSAAQAGREAGETARGFEEAECRLERVESKALKTKDALHHMAEYLDTHSNIGSGKVRPDAEWRDLLYVNPAPKPAHYGENPYKADAVQLRRFELERDRMGAIMGDIAHRTPAWPAMPVTVTVRSPARSPASLATKPHHGAHGSRSASPARPKLRSPVGRHSPGLASNKVPTAIFTFAGLAEASLSPKSPGMAVSKPGRSRSPSSGQAGGRSRGRAGSPVRWTQQRIHESLNA